jgi:hypothetical protein
VAQARRVGVEVSEQRMPHRGSGRGLRDGVDHHLRRERAARGATGTIGECDHHAGGKRDHGRAILTFAAYGGDLERMKEAAGHVDRS